MKQLLYEIYNTDSLDASLVDIERYACANGAKEILFHLYCGVTDEAWLAAIISRLQEDFPEAGIAGVASHAEIIDGHLTDPVVVLSAMVFASTTITVACFPDILGKEAEFGKKVCSLIDGTKDVKAAELLVRGAPVDGYIFLQEVAKCNPEVKIFGAYPLVHDIGTGKEFLLDKEGIHAYGAVIVLYAGEDFHIDVAHTVGWRSLGRGFTVTKAHQNILEEVDGFPAANLYERYLKISPGENLMINASEFPLFVEDDGMVMLRHPTASTNDGTLELAGYVNVGNVVYMSYGDPNSIIADVDKRCEDVREFEPEAILLYTCTMRKIFWNYFINNEMAPFQKIATTAGFCTGGELNRDMRTGKVMWHNITLLSILMREGEKTGRYIPLAKVDTSALHGEVGLVQRLTTLVQETSRELREAVEELTEANRKLTRMATIDVLTELYNRREIERRINAALDRAAETGGQVALVMMDIDHFKSVNDTYGHEAGDKILEGVAAVLNSLVREYEGEAAGRWGGEEFFFLLPNEDSNSAIARAEEIRQTIELYPFPYVEKLTCSVGVTLASGTEERKGVYARVDNALYQAKSTGRNKTVVK